MVGWNHSLLEHHSYRQSQTAMAVEYMISDHAWINYMTPVLGPPWQVPLEFPLYQMIVAGLCLLLHTPIDQTGRAVSLFFFYACLWPMNLFLKRLVPEQNLRYVILSLVLVSPVYIYFSRVVMIESAALFFGFLFLWLSTRQVLRPTAGGMAALLFFGSLCALIKITTFCAACFPCLIVPILDWLSRSGRSPSEKKEWLVRHAGVLGSAWTIPLLAGAWWTHRADAIKLSSPATEELTSAGLSSWNFGTLAQRLDPQAWLDVMARVSFGLTFCPFLIAIFAALFFVRKEERRAAVLLLVSALIPVLVFFNLYVVHDYYFYASSVYLIFAIGYLLACLIRRGSKWAKPLWLAMAIAFISMYGTFMFGTQWSDNAAMAEVVEAVRENSGEGDYLLIYGDVWDSRIPYHAKRKAFMNYFFNREEIERLDAKMEKLEGWDKIRLAVVNSDAMPVQPYLRDRLVSLGFPEKPDVEINGFSLYRKSPKP